MRFLLFILLTTTQLAASADSFQGIVKDSNRQPISSAHVYFKNNPGTGTLTNQNGIFHLAFSTTDSIIVLSHINYETKEIKLSSGNQQIKLVAKKNLINEIKVSALSAESILQIFFENMKANHAVEPVNYKAFTRILSTKDSALFMIEEYYLDLQVKKSHNTSFNIIKARAKPTNEYGQKEFKDLRLISLSKMRSDNLFKYREDILMKRNLNNYTLKLKGYTDMNYRDNYIIEFQNKETPYDKGILYIDKETFALSSAQFRDKSINFFFTKNKWYIRDVSTTFSSISGEDEERISIYQLENHTYNLKGKKLIMVEKIKPFIGDFNDNFWEQFTHIPIEEKYLNQINNRNKY